MLNTNEFKMGGKLVSKNILLGITESNGKEYISATLTLQVGENKRTEVSMFAYKLKEDGSLAKSFVSLETIKDEYMSLHSEITDRRKDKNAKPIKDEATTCSKIEECDFVSVNKGVKLQMNRYMKEGVMQESFRMSTMFVNRAENKGEGMQPYLEGNLICIVDKDAVEITDEDTNETYLKVNVTVPTYRPSYGTREEDMTVEKFTLYLREEEIPEGEWENALAFSQDMLVKGAVCCLGVIPTIKVVTEEAPVEEEGKRGFGRVSKFKPSTKIVRELRLVGGYDLEPEEYEDDENFKYDLYEKALKEYEQKIEDMKNGVGKSTTVAKGFGGANKGFGSPKTKNNDEIPF